MITVTSTIQALRGCITINGGSHYSSYDFDLGGANVFVDKLAPIMIYRWSTNFVVVSFDNYGIQSPSKQCSIDVR